MLHSLRIANYVLIEDCRLEFHPGLNVLTGETGAGKSIIVDALSLLIGERGSTESLREANRESVVEAAFELDFENPLHEELRNWLEASGISHDGTTLLIKRILSPEGRNRIFLNNSQCLLKQLREIGTLLVDLHGQHEHQSLLNKSTYRALLDGWGDYKERLTEYRQVYSEWRRIREELEQIELHARERKRREDTLRRQIEEIEKAQLEEGEMERVENRLQVIRHAERLHECCTAILNSMSEGDTSGTPILDELDRLESLLSEMIRMDAHLLPLQETWQSAVIALREISRELEGYSQTLEYDPGEQERLQQRRFLIRDLLSKYGASIAEVAVFHQNIREELDCLQTAEQNLDQLRTQENELRSQVIHRGRQLHDQRCRTAETLSQKVTSELQLLGMEAAKFEILVQYRLCAEGFDLGQEQPVNMGPNGADEVEFLVSTIPDRPPRPLREVASGGEVSRIMLALKCTFSEADPVPTMIFDEIDVGVGGKTAEIVAERLALLAKHKQVLCITHLPHIASRADRNLKVEKRETNGKWICSVSELTGKERAKELARMLGSEDSAASQRFAREMLQSSKK